MFEVREEVRITYLSRGVRFVGDVHGIGTFVCDGEIEGKIEFDGIVQVTPIGKVRGGLRAKEAEVAGSVEGDILTGHRLTLRSTCRLQGGVVTPRLIVEPGAIFQGQIHMVPEGTEAVVEPGGVVTRGKNQLVPLRQYIRAEQQNLNRVRAQLEAGLSEQFEPFERLLASQQGLLEQANHFIDEQLHPDVRCEAVPEAGQGGE